MLRCSLGQPLMHGVERALTLAPVKSLTAR